MRIPRFGKPKSPVSEHVRAKTEREAEDATVSLFTAAARLMLGQERRVAAEEVAGRSIVGGFSDDIELNAGQEDLVRDIASALLSKELEVDDAWETMRDNLHNDETYPV